jgi:hypothetical protein
MFSRFAENRASTGEGDWPERVRQYFAIVREHYVTWPPLLGVVGLLALLALIRRTILVQLCAAFVVISMIALLNHPYVLSRNLVSVAGVGILGASAAVANISRRQWRVLAFVGLFGFSAVGTMRSFDHRSTIVDRYYSPSSLLLQAASDTLIVEARRQNSLHVVGTFNELSAGWVLLVNRTQAPSSKLTVGGAYPLPGGRRGRSAQWDDAYSATVTKWADAEIARVISIRLTADSPFRALDYELWGEWKANFWTALDQSDAYAEATSLELDGGVLMSAFDLVEVRE